MGVKHIWIGGAPAKAQIDFIAFPSDVETGQTVSFTIGVKTLAVPLTAATQSLIIAEVVAAWNASVIPEFAEITASVGVDSLGTMNLTADTAGQPFAVTVAIGTGNNEIQVVTLGGTTATGGTFTLTYAGQTTGAIAYNASAATVEAALEALSNIGAGDVTVTGSAGGPYTVEFTGALAATNVAVITSDASSLTGGVSEVQTITLINSPSAGSFTLDYDGEVTAAIAYTATGATIQTELESLPKIKVGDATVSGVAGGPWTVTFAGDLIPDVSMLVAVSSLTAPPASAASSVGGGGLDQSRLHAYWTMDEASGPRADSIGSRTLSDINTVTSATGLIGNAASFDGSNSEFLSVSLAEDDALYFQGANANFSIVLWVKFGSMSGTFPVITMAGAGSANGLYSVYMTGGKIRFEVQEAASTTLISAESASIQDSTWYMLTCVHDSTAGKIKIKVDDGAFVETAFTGGIRIPSSYPNILYIGTSGSYYFTGEIDEVSIWNEALSDADLGVLYNDGFAIGLPSINGENEVQTLTFTGTPTSGNVSISFLGEEALIPYNATASEAEALLEALSTIGAGNVDVTGGAWPGTALAVEFINTLGVSSQPLLVVNNTPVDLSIVETTKGVSAPTVTIATTHSPLTHTTSITSEGPNDWNTAANWDMNTVPAATDDPIIYDGDDILYGLDQSAVALNRVEFYQFGTKIGLPRRNAIYHEYKERLLKLNAAEIVIGLGDNGRSSSRINIEIVAGSNPLIEVHDSGSGEDGEPAVQFTGVNSANTAELLILGGEVGVGALPKQAGYFKKVTQRGGELRIGSDVGIAELIKTDGNIISDRTTIGGETTL